jgi:uncharacterized membrane protein
LSILKSKDKWLICLKTLTNIDKWGYFHTRKAQSMPEKIPKTPKPTRGFLELIGLKVIEKDLTNHDSFFTYVINTIKI